jgi:hypothetical protein
MTPLKRLYLDIDGVLLTVKQTKPADHSTTFIEFITENFDCYWLTTHCKGDAHNAIKYLTPYFDEQTLQLLSQVKPTKWETLKTEAIDFSQNFFWLEDYPFNAEKEVLAKYGRLENLIVVDLNNTDELRRIVEVLDNYC